MILKSNYGKGIKDFSEKNRLGLYITREAGGISNRAGFGEYLEKEYFGTKEVSFKSSTFHPSNNYKVENAVEVK
ncbi:hypothetical protein KAW38_01705 [Candidatus Micrarchaeota archaeon]|nr:hypothetical protein [Candidatus Micrarchaeota archaeon]